MSVIVGVHDPRGAQRLVASLATAAAVDPRAAFTIGPLVIAGTQAPERFGAVSCLLAGELHDAENLARSLGLPPGCAPGLVAAKGFSQAGTTFLRDLRGAYQLALWDDVTRETTVVQDHLTARAIFYRADGTCVYFASDIAPLLRVLPRRPEPDSDTIPRWITDRSLPGGLTLYRGVRRLQTGYALQIAGAHCRVQRVWEPRYAPPRQLTPEEAGELLRTAVRRSVQRRLTVDGTTGILLSGGFDSGTLAGTAAPLLRAHGQTLPAYSATFPGEPWDESDDVKLLVSEHRLPSTQLHVSGGTLSTALNFQHHWELPQPGPGSILDTPLLFRAYRDGLRVMLAGQGGDEVFAAAPYLITDHFLGGRWGAARDLAHSFPGARERLQAWQVRSLLKQILFRGALPYRAHRFRIAGTDSEYSGLDWLTPRSRRIAEELDDPWAWKRRADRGPRWWAYLAHLLADAPELSGMQDYLRRRATMAGIDSREPLLTDVDLIEQALSLPPEYAFSSKYDRALGREAMVGIVPERIRVPVRKKSDYSELMRRTLAGSDLPELRRLLDQRDAEVGAFVDLSRMRETILNPPRAESPGWRTWGPHVWALATTELWLRSQALGSSFPEWVDALQLQPPHVETIASKASPGQIEAGLLFLDLLGAPAASRLAPRDGRR